MLFVVSDLAAGVTAWLLLCVPVLGYLWVAGRLSELRRVAWRLAPVAVFYGVYAGLVRWTARPSVVVQALGNGEALVGFERRLHLAWEAAWSGLSLPGSTLYYDWMQVFVVVGVLLWCALNEADDFWRVCRNSLALIAGVGFLCYWLVPMAPPWVLPASYGIHSAGLGSLVGVGELLGAFPSLHTAWAGWAAVVLWSVVPGRLRWLGVANVVLTGFVVIATGNHYVLDVVAGEALAWSSCVLVSWYDVRRRGLGMVAPHGVVV